MYPGMLSDTGDLECALPRVPAVIGGGEASGTRFGDQPDSRLEYDGIPGGIVERFVTFHSCVTV